MSCCCEMNRRDFMALSAVGAAGVTLGLPPAARATGTSEAWNPDKPLVRVGKSLKIQPVLMYRVAQHRNESSWKSWGGVQTDESAKEEVKRITRELADLKAKADFAVEVLPVKTVQTVEEAAALHDKSYDVIIVYPATGSGKTLQACFGGQKNTIVFVRHKSGPVYYWYEALSVEYLQTDKPGERPGKLVHNEDVVVDDYSEMLWRLRAFYGVKNLLGTRIVALGGAWGKYSAEAPQLSRDQFGLQIIETGYDDMEKRITAALADRGLMREAEKWTDRYLALPNTTLKTEKKFVVNGFMLYKVFKDLVRENNADAFTIKSCMGTIIPMSKTTACLTLGLLNDEGLPAFCESDFVVIPPALLLYHISGKPVFLHNSTFPHQGMVTCAHCIGPRRMDGEHYDPAEIMTHYESEYGAAPKVSMPIGQELTFLDPEYSTLRWLGFKGIVKDNPFYEICRSQQDVEIVGDWKKLLAEVRDSHWVAVYGDYMRETQYAARRIGVKWEGLG